MLFPKLLSLCACALLLPLVSAELSTQAITAGVYFGSASRNSDLSDPAYLNIFGGFEIGQITPIDAMTWEATEPTQNNFNYTAGDVIYGYTQTSGQFLHGSSLVGTDAIPSWVIDGGFSATELTKIIQNHIANVAGHWKGGMFHWNVVNEAFNDDGTFQENVLYKTLDQDYISIAFKAAKAADPSAKLYLNENGLELSGPKFDAVLALVKSLLADGVPIDGVGFQGHVAVGHVPTTWQANMQAFTALGLDVAITELDVRIPLPATDADLAQQATDYHNIASSCVSIDHCVGITVSEITDKYSSVPELYPGQGAACIWDEDYNQKPAYLGVYTAFEVPQRPFQGGR